MLNYSVAELRIITQFFFPLATRSPRPTICRYLASDNVGRANCTNSTSGQSNPSENISTFTNTCIGASPSAARKQVAPSPSPARKQVSVRRSHSAQSGETFDAPLIPKRSPSPSVGRKQVAPRRSHPAQSGEGFDAPPTLERSGSERRGGAVTSPLPEEEGLGEKVEPSLERGTG